MRFRKGVLPGIISAPLHRRTVVAAMNRSPSIAVRLWLVTVALSLAPAAQAYLDPSTGSMILSAVVGIFATISLALKTYWYRLKRLLRRSPESTSAPSAGADGRDDGRAPPAGNC
jgi:amino acid transporter